MQEANNLRPVPGTPAGQPFLQGGNAFEHALVAQWIDAGVTVTPQNAFARREVLLRICRQHRKQRSDRAGIAAIGDRLLYLGHHPHDNVVLSHDHWIGRLRDLL